MGDELIHGAGANESKVAARGSFCLWDGASYALIALLLLLAVSVFRDYGISNDEEVQHRYGSMIIAYYTSGLTDRALFSFKNLYLYGGLFDVIAVLVEKALPFDRFLIRHLLCGLTGVAGIAATFMTARLVGGPRAGFIAAAALSVCGPWFGAMFNHTKDIPFAAAMIGAVYCLLRVMRELPTARWRHVIGFGVLLGIALALRAIGLLLVGYAGIAILLAATTRSRAEGVIEFLARSVLRLLPAFAISYLIMIVFWPWAALDPFNPIRALYQFSEFNYEIRTILADRLYDMAAVPWWYVPVYVAIKLPTTVLGGLAAFFALFPLRCWRADKSRSEWTDGRNPCREIGFILFVAVFPMLCEITLRGPAFSGVRHFSFLIPPLAVICALGFDQALKFAEARVARVFAMGAVASVLVWDASIMVRLHPYEILHYNFLVGGLEGASRKYVMDYWLNMLPEAIRELGVYLDRIEAQDNGARRAYKVGICGEKFAFENYADSRMQYTDRWLEADFYISPTHMDCDRLVDGKTIVTIERFGVPIGVVKDHRGVNQTSLNPLHWRSVVTSRH